MSSDTKIQIWKQFTTTKPSWLVRHSCVIRYKDTNLKAIHNVGIPQANLAEAVSSDTKIQIWKQFTTCWDRQSLRVMLCHPIQRYKFESNSQRLQTFFAHTEGCVIRYKDTNLKAIHNSPGYRQERIVAVSSDTKIQIWKQFTTHALRLRCQLMLCHPIQRYKFESNSQHFLP